MVDTSDAFKAGFCLGFNIGLVLCREADMSAVTSRLYFLIKHFLLRLLAAPPGLRKRDIVPVKLQTPDSTLKWDAPL